MKFEELARQSQKAFEAFVAMIFFAPEATKGYAELGLKAGPGYLCWRSAPMGAVPGQVIAATFYTFNPDFVISQTNKGWKLTTPQAAQKARLEAVGAALHRLLNLEEDAAEILPKVEEALELAKKATASLSPLGRALFAAHQAVEWPSDSVVALWHGLNLLREYRGDGHMAVLLTEGIDGIESIILQNAYTPAMPLTALLQSHVWDQEKAEAAHARLVRRGFMLEDGSLTPAGQGVRERIELSTDRLDTAPFEALGEEDSLRLIALAKGLSKLVVSNGGLPYISATKK